MLKECDIFRNCKICNIEFSSIKLFVEHLKSHKISKKEYYLKYIFSSGDDYCKLCKTRKTNFTFGSKKLGIRYFGYFDMCSECSKGITLEKCILRHGKDLGESVWKSYCEKQSNSNKFEYKHANHGWSLERYKEYNNSRSITLENCIRRHGEEKGKLIWKEYCEKQKYSGCSKEYFIDKYGPSEGLDYYKNVNKKKNRNVDWYVMKYGYDIGMIEYKKYRESFSKKSYSKISQELFNILLLKMKCKDKLYFAEHNKEFSSYNKENKKFYFYDFVCTSIKKVIEFNGEIFHPKFKNDENFKNPFNKNMTSSEAYEYDKVKIEHIKSLGYDVLVIWENEYKNDKILIVDKCLKFLEG